MFSTLPSHPKLQRLQLRLSANLMKNSMKLSARVNCFRFVRFLRYVSIGVVKLCGIKLNFMVSNEKHLVYQMVLIHANSHVRREGCLIQTTGWHKRMACSAMLYAFGYEYRNKLAYNQPEGILTIKRIAAEVWNYTGRF